MKSWYVVELRDSDPGTVEDLVLNSCESAEIEGLTIRDKLVKLQSLSMVHVGLQSFKNMPKLSMPSKLDISDNSIAGGLEHVADNCPLGAAKKDVKLCEPDLFNNPGTAGGDSEYRSKVFEMIPSLQILHGSDVNAEDVDDSLDGEDGIEGEDSGDESVCDLDGPGLSYPDNSQLDDDESEEYKPFEEVGEDSAKRGFRRRNKENNGDESGSKKKADDE
ncbi:unnamed protein product [Nippostrongylus brasiliensis]|uniref:LRR domain containing protein n=1 Tax=Nippostrongylus brasiliensis TaxID=27835 RepID=A0A0N4YD67_NIPBR|nr:unnamed protein product [Nippostrongylus brasiliensis]